VHGGPTAGLRRASRPLLGSAVRWEKGLCLPEALVTAAGLLLGSCAGLLAARRLCATNTRKRAGEGGPEAAQASWEREGSLSSLA
jgi:hypothetical protein